MKFNRRHALIGFGGAALTNCAWGSKPSDIMDADVLILGAGLAGLRAAQILTEAGQDVLVLEAKERLGGRVFTVNDGTHYADAGGSRIRETDSRLNRLAKELGLTLTPDTARFEEFAYWLDGKPVNFAAWTERKLQPYLSPFIPNVSDMRILGGAQRLPEAMAIQLPRPPRLKTYIESLSVSKTMVSATDHKGRIWKAPKMLCTLPFSALRHVRLDANLPDQQKAAIAKLPYVQNIQILFRAKIKFWEKDGLPPDMLSDGPLGRITANRDPMGQPTGLFCCSLYGQNMNALYQNGKAGLYQRFQTELTKLRPSSYAAIEVLKVVNWTKDNLGAGGAYWNASANQKLDWIKSMSQSYRGLYFAGSQHGLGTIGMEGALESAERAAAAILD